MTAPQTQRPPLPLWKRVFIALPTAFLVVFFLLPFLVVLQISLSEADFGVPPYRPLFTWAEQGVLQVTLFFRNFTFVASDALYLAALVTSLKVAAICTAICLVIGYPVAFYIARAPDSLRNLLLLAVILPFWTSFLLRVYAWMGFLNNSGLINNALIWLGLTDQPLQMIRTDGAIYLGIVYSYLPFMILPLYANLQKLDGTLLEAAADLGARPMRTFLHVVLPLSLPGILAGSLLVFIPAVGEFVIPELLGPADNLMVGRVLWNEFFLNRDWPVASAIAMLLLVILVLPIMFLRNAQQAEVRQ